MKLQQPFYIDKRKMQKNHLNLNGQWDFCYLDNCTDTPQTLSF